MPSDPSYPIRAVIFCPTREKEISALLRPSGFRIFKAKSLNEAIGLVHSEHCHVALVCYDSVKDALSLKREEIFSSLSENFHLAHCFVLCGSRIATREAEVAFDAGIHVTPMGKKYLMALPDKIQKITNQHRSANLRLEWEILEETILPAILNNNEEEVHWVLGHILPRASELRVDSLRGTGQSVVLEGRINGMASPALIKIGRAVKIQQEIDNYERFIYRQLSATYHAIMDQRYCWWNLGSILYTFIGSNSGVESFSDFYQRAKTRQVRDVLTRLYERILISLYHRKSLLQDSIFEVYDSSLNLTKRLRDFSGPAIGFGLPDPINWVMSNKQRSHLRQEHVLIFEAISHGDLWGENILVEGTRCWVVDYERTGWGHALRDFVELEVDIITRLVRLSSEDLIVFYELAIALARPSTVLGYLPYWTARLKDNSEALKAFNAIDHLRYLADRIMGYMDVREYYWGLLLDALFATTLAPAGSPQQERTLLLASVLCGRLENWGREEWPPKGWPQVEWEETSHDLLIVRDKSPIHKGAKQEHAADAFLSYNSNDRNAVQSLAKQLKGRFELKVWLDRWNLLPGDPWQEEIEQILDRCATCIVFWGPSGLGPWQHEEMRTALERRVKELDYRVIPVLLPRCANPEKMPLFLRRMTWVDFRNGLTDQDALQYLIAGIQMAVSGSTGAKS
jgi:hypothetical protein